VDPERAHLVDETPTLGCLPADPAIPDAPEGRRHLAVVLAAELRVLVDQRDAEAVAGGRAGRGEARRARPDDGARDRAHPPPPPPAGSRRSSTRIPSRTGVVHARTLGRPSTATRQSWQTPMPQKYPRGSPVRCVHRVSRRPEARSAAAMLSPSQASTR